MTSSSPADAGPDEGQADRPDARSVPAVTQDPVLAEPGDEPAGQPGADEPADAGRGEGEAVLPGREPELGRA